MHPDELRDRLVLLVRQAARDETDEDWELEAQLLLATAPGVPCSCCGSRTHCDVLCRSCSKATCSVQHARARGCKLNKEID